MVPTPRTRLFLLVAAAVPLALASGCPQLASDDFTKADEPFDADSNGAGGGDDGSANSTSLDLSSGTHASSDSNDTSSSTSQDGTDAGSSDDTSASSDTSANTGGSTSTSDTGGTGGSTTSDTSSGGTGGSTSDTGTGGIGGTGGTGGTDGETTSSGCVEAVEVCDGLDNDCDGDVDDESACDTNFGCLGFPFEDHGYMYCPRPASQAEAAAQCEDQGMTLVQIDSESENDEMVAQASSGWSGGTDGTGGSGSGTTWGGGTRTTTGGEQEQEVFWTGGSDAAVEGEWIWSGSETLFWEGDADGDAVDGAYTNWGEGRPNEANDEGDEDCVAVYLADGPDGDMGTWNDLLCEYSYPFICESPASD